MEFQVLVNVYWAAVALDNTTLVYVPRSHDGKEGIVLPHNFLARNRINCSGCGCVGKDCTRNVVLS